MLQVAIYGMNEKIGLLSFPQEEGSFNKPYSDDTARLIDGEVRTLVDTAYQRTLGLLRDKRELVEALAQALLEKEVRAHVLMHGHFEVLCELSHLRFAGVCKTPTQRSP